MPQVFIVMRRPDIPNGTLQVLDIWPNTSNKNSIYPPGLGQTGYVHSLPDYSIASSVAAGPPQITTAPIIGLSAYLIGNIDTGAGPGGPTLTAAEADTASNAISTLARSGSDLSLAQIDGVLGGIVAGTTLEGGGSTGTLPALLSVLAGNRYEIMANVELSDGAGNFAGAVGGFVLGTYKQLYSIGPFKVSNYKGNLSKMRSPKFVYDGTLGAAVQIYLEDGTVYP